MLVVSMQICVLLFLLVATAWGGELRCLRPGAPVISRYRENRYFPGRVDGLGDSIDVIFENGQQQTYGSFTNEVIVDDVPDINELAGGARVLARRPRSTSFEPGFVNGSIEGLPMNDTFLVNFDSGDSIARNIQDIRIADKPRSCMNEKGIYIGCFENVINNFLTNYYPVNPTDIATCNWACFTRGFRFAGLQNGTWCFCGNHVNDTLKVDDNDCNIACRDSREDVCGGYQRMTVYWTGADYGDNNTRDFGEFADAKGQEASDQDLLKLESSTKRACVDVYNSEQCNTWADQAKCIENPDWMIANCKKSCYACDYDEHNSDDKPDSSLEKYTPVTSSSPQSQPNMYQSPAGYQTSSDYAQNSYSTSKKSDHSVLDSTGNTPGYLGCFRDSPTSHDLEYLADIRPLSIRGCITKCKSMRFPYSGVQSSSSCYCGLHYGKYGQLEHEDCNTPCEADASEMCGGISKNSLYHTGFPVKFKSAESGLTRKNLPSLAVNNADSSRAYPPNPSYNYPSQYLQPYYPQQNRGYAPPVYPPPSSYTQASSYPQTSSVRTNEYQSAYNYNNQPSSSVQSGTTNSGRRDFSPADSSSYRWRETYVKLRQQEQDRYSKPSPRNLKRISKLPQNPWPKIRGNSAKSPHPRKDKTKDSSKLQNLGNDAKTVKDTSSQSSSRSNSFSQSLYNQLMSQMYTNSQGRNSHGNKKIHRRKSTKRRRKHLQGKPGVFLRKKASKESSFLAFLPHEVTKNESLLQNVYNMLSVMLKNLRKHKKSSMKNLKKYLKFSESDEENSKFARKMSSHVSGHKKRTHQSKKRAERKWKGAKTHKSAKVDSKRVEPAPLQHQEMAKNHSSLGQKQLSKPEEISNPGMQPMTYTPRDDQTMTNGSLAAKHVMSSRGKSAVNLNKTAQSFRDVVKTHHSEVTGLNRPNMSRNVSTFQKQTKKVSDVHRNLSEAVPKVRKAGKLSDHHENGARIQETTRSYNSQLPNNNLEKFGDTFKHSTKPAERSFQTQSRKNASLDENIRKAVSPKTKPTKGILKKLNNKKLNKKKLNKKKLPRLKTKGTASVNHDQQEAKSQANEDDTMEESDDDTMEKSNDEMISSIVDLLEKEKRVRMKNNSDNQSTQDSGKRKQPEKEEKRKKRNNKKGKHERKHRTGKNDEEKTTKRIYKKDHLGRAGGAGETRDDHDYNLMQEDEDFREINGNNIE